MPVKIRLMRIGAKKRPFYRVVAVDEQKKRTGAYLELLGTYNPLTEPKEINLRQDRIDEWLKKGAQPSDGFLRIIGKAPQRPPRKPKKAAKEAPEATPAATAKEANEVAPEAAAESTEEVAPTPADQVDAPVESEESIKEAPMPESAEEAAEVLSEKSEQPERSGESEQVEASETADSSDNSNTPEEDK